VGSAHSAILLLECIEHFIGSPVFSNPEIQIQVCSPGRLDPHRSALLAIGFYLGSDTLRRYTSSPIVTADWTAAPGQQWTVPVGGGFGRVFKVGDQPIDASVQGFYNVVRPDNGPTWSLRVQGSLLFPDRLAGTHTSSSDCNDERRLDVHNGLLHSALWDAAFDCGLVSFADNGSVLASSQLSETSRRTLDLDNISPLTGLRDAHRANLALHRARNGFHGL